MSQKPDIHPTILKRDWCHLCGVRAFHVFANIWYPQNAEHDDENTRYLRVCPGCATRIVETIQPVEDSEQSAYLERQHQKLLDSERADYEEFSGKP
jgi:hypothetical protein